MGEATALRSPRSQQKLLDSWLLRARNCEDLELWSCYLNFRPIVPKYDDMQIFVIRQGGTAEARSDVKPSKLSKTASRSIRTRGKRAQCIQYICSE